MVYIVISSIARDIYIERPCLKKEIKKGREKRRKGSKRKKGRKEERIAQLLFIFFVRNHIKVLQV